MSKQSQIVANTKPVKLLGSIVSGRVILLGILAVLLLVYIATIQVGTGEAPVYLLLTGLLLHYFIFSRQISTPLLYSVLFCILIIPLFALSAFLGVGIFFACSAYFFHTTLRDEEWFHVAPLMVFYAGILVHATLLTPLRLADSSTYFAQLDAYASIQEYMQVFISLLFENPIWIHDFAQKFPLLYLPFYFSLNLTSPLFILIINGMLWILSTLMLTQLSVEYIEERVDGFSSQLFFILLLVSPSLMLYASQFAKEIPTLFFTVLAVYLFFKDRYVSFLLATLAAFYLRPYVLVAILVYVFFFKGDRLLMTLTAVTAFLVLAVDSGSIVAIANGGAILPYMFLSPIPFELENWTSIRAGFRPLEAVVMGGAALVGGYVFLLDREYRMEYVLLTLGLLAWALTLSWVGFDRVQAGNFEGPAYDFLVFGVHVVRKKLPVMPILIAWVVLTVGGVREYIVDVTLQHE